MKGSVQVLVVANVSVDETYAVLSTPKPGEPLIGEFRSRDVGGKGANVATILARCGIATRLMAGIGADCQAAIVQCCGKNYRVCSHCIPLRSLSVRAGDNRSPSVRA